MSIKVPMQRTELNITDLCNRKCNICPRAWGYPNQDLHMETETAEVIFKTTAEYTNYVSLAGRGEPLLCKNFLEILELSVKYKKHIHIITNADILDKFIDDIHSLINLNEVNMGSGKHKMMINSYDGEEQKKERIEKWGHFKGLDFPDPKIFNANDHHSTKKLVNRGGVLPWGKPEVIEKPCFILFHRGYFNWNGDVGLCCNNWEDIKSFGNIHDRPFKEIWEGDEMMLWREKLSIKNGRQSFKQCIECDAAQEWSEQKQNYRDFVKGKIQKFDYFK